MRYINVTKVGYAIVSNIKSSVQASIAYFLSPSDEKLTKNCLAELATNTIFRIAIEALYCITCMPPRVSTRFALCSWSS